MSMRIRKLARDENDLFKFLAETIRNNWAHTDGNGYGELAKIWWNVRKGA